VSSRLATSGPGTLATTLLIVLAPFAFGYFLSNLFRAVNAVVAPNLAADLGLGAAALGLLTSAYLFAFALFQLPLGVLLDRFGPRRVQTALLACAATGSLLFATGQDSATLTCARALIGLGFAGGLMSGFKAVVLWVPEPRRALANAAIMSFGALGILVATVPTELAVQAVGWRAVFVGLAAITFAVAALIFVAVPERAMGASAKAWRVRSPRCSASCATARSGAWRRCSRPPPAATSPSRRCGRAPGFATSPASIAPVSPTT
jgi:MFS family permease